jgi:hypothetical protein
MNRFRNRPRYKAHLPSEHDPNQSNDKGASTIASNAGAPTKPNMYWWSATGELEVLYVVIGCAIGWRVS